MARPRKQPVDYLRVMAMAMTIADEARIARTGYAMARWFEQIHGMESGSLDPKPWRLFLRGHQPQHSTLNKLLLACPQASDVYHHPLWKLLKEDCDYSTRIDVLNRYGAVSPSSSYYLFKELQKYKSFDRLAIFIASTCTAIDLRGGQAYQDFLDVVAQLLIERKWTILQEEFSSVVFGAVEKVGGVFFDSASYEIHGVIKFWEAVYEGYYSPAGRDYSDVWLTWRCVIREMNWLERMNLAKYLRTRADKGSAENIDGEKQLKRIQRKVYRCCPRTITV